MQHEKIRELNDQFRKTFQGGRIVITPGVRALGQESLDMALALTRHFKDFDESNDPHHEHDFGAFDVNGEKHFFKIDYYDHKLEYGSEDPADPSKTTRVLTIMLASEY